MSAITKESLLTALAIFSRQWVQVLAKFTFSTLSRIFQFFSQYLICKDQEKACESWRLIKLCAKHSA